MEFVELWSSSNYGVRRVMEFVELFEVLIKKEVEIDWTGCICSSYTSYVWGFQLWSYSSYVWGFQLWSYSSHVWGFQLWSYSSYVWGFQLCMEFPGTELSELWGFTM